MAKYDPLRDHLQAQGAEFRMSMDAIADLVGGLPASAYRYTAWWNDHDSTHPQCRSWNDAGFRALPDLAQRSVTFQRL